MSGRVVCVLMVAGMLMTTMNACAERERDVQGGPDISKLNVGNYQTEPRHLGTAKTLRQAEIRESQRLSDYVALPFEADPTYTEEDFRMRLRPHLVVNGKGLSDLIPNDTFDEVADDLVAGWLNYWSTGGPLTASRRKIALAVLEFPDAKTAAEVGPTLEHDDFTYKQGNVAVRLPKYPDSKAHWQPNISEVRSWTAHDRYVVFIKVVDDASAPDIAALTAHVERMLAVQLPLLDKFTPTPADKLKNIPLDPDGLLGRTLPTNPEYQLRPDPDGVFTGRGALGAGFKESSLDFLRVGDLDLISFGDGVVFRSRTDKASQALWQTLRPTAHPDPKKKMVAPPTGLGERIECWTDLGIKVGPSHFCMLQVGRYFAQTAAQQIQDLRQKISAQYALLVSR